jgi:hypothetical protein
MRMESIRSYLANYWQAWLSALAALVFAGFLLLVHLRSLPTGISLSEWTTLHSMHSLHAMLQDPLFAPYQVGLYLLSSTQHLTIFTARLLSVSFGLSSLLLMFYVLKHWHGNRTALIGSFLFATSSWFLTYSRLAIPAISYALVICALAYGVWAQKAKRPGLIMGLGAALALGLIYTPGLIWFAILMTVWQRKRVARQIALAPKLAGAVAIIFALCLIPLFYALYLQPNLIRLLLGMSQMPLHQLASFPHQLLHILSELAWHGNGDPSTGLKGVALLDFFTGIIAILGVGSYLLRYKLDRAKILIGGSILGAVLVALQGAVSIVILLPFTYIFASAGIDYLLESWFTVFPRNPLARGLAVTLITLAVILAGFYHIERYFVAWPKAPETRQAFNRF